MTRLKSSLTLRIFWITCLLLIAACGITYGAIAYLTPISYTSLLADELSRESAALMERLSGRTKAECTALLQDFARQTGADMRLVDEYGNVLYDTIPEASSVGVAYESSEVVAEEAATVAGESCAEAAGWVEAVSESPIISQVIIAENDVVEDAGIPFALSDGTGATLMIRGGQRAVNQSVEAMKQILPFLLLVIVGISLLGSFFYARYITKPIVSISQIARRIARLDFGARWRVKRADEIGTLGESLNQLSDNLSGALAELEQANQALRRDMDRERELDRQRLAFFSAASHELKTPVTILKGQLSGMLAQVGVYRDREKYLARALGVTGRMEGLIREILTISRLESGGFALNAAEVSLAGLIQKQLTLDEELIDQKRLRVRTEMEPDIVLQGSAHLLANALDNVLMNAIVYSPPGATIRIRFTGRSVSIENTGVSIPEDALPQLFTAFYRVEQSRNRKSGGSGLGLYLVKRILELHGATCSVENAPDGVRFTASFG